MSHDQCKPCGDDCGNTSSLTKLPDELTTELKAVLVERQKEKMNLEEPGTGLSEVQLIGVLVQNLTKLTKAEAKRVIEYAERLYEDKFGKDKVYR